MEAKAKSSVVKNGVIVPLFVLGIDPDVDKCGFACWDTKNKKLQTVKSISFWKVIEEIESLSCPIHIIIEAGWLIKKSNWHKAQGKLQRERISKNVGANHQAGKLIAQYCEERNIPYSLTKPKGKTYSKNAKTFNLITGWVERTNEDSRDAAMLVFKWN